MKNIKNCKIERDVENTFFRSIRFSLYSRNHPYEHICGCGPNASTLHYLDNDCELEQGKLILMDILNAEANRRHKLRSQSVLSV